ncbi:MAG: CxxxxCH/CxxCH domain-containing protein [Polyangia bacterium]|jgi:predicted CxxxxCH...CXXCH cytochrome family protein
MKHSLAAAGALAVLIIGCTKARPLVDDPRACPNWEHDIGPLFREKCGSCHSPGDGGQAQGSYDITTYNLALGTGTPPDVIAGDANCTLLSVLNPATATGGPHEGMSDVYAETKKWVVDCRAGYLDEATSVHTAGILDPAQPDYHGTILLNSNFNFGLCQKCHGQDFAGGAAGVSCLPCHQGSVGLPAADNVMMNPDGTPGCAACHAATPASGKHGIHVDGGLLAKQFACSTCHPDRQSAQDHAFASDGSLRTGPAQVSLTGLAALTPADGTRAGPPAWDANLQTCSNVYCHGATYADSAAVTNSPNWEAAARPSAQTCTFCHGLPPNGAGGTRCSTCHYSVVDAQANLVSTSLHLDGTVEFADVNTPCSTCHGSVNSPAPPPDLEGNTDSSAVGVGQHQRHVVAPVLNIRGPIQCSECHQVPADASTPGHYGTGHAPGSVAAAAVFPNVAGSGTLARAQGASPVWNSSSMTCTGAYCHGGGEPLNTDTTPGIEQTPNWVSPGSGACGATCHGTPPQFLGHPTGIARTGCVVCHAKTVDANGNIIFTGPAGAQTTTHMNGVFDDD